MSDAVHYRSAKKYTRFVRRFKRVLWIMVALLLVAVVALPVINEDSAGVRMIFSSDDVPESEQPVMKKPKFQGISDDDNPYLVTADYAIQKSDTEVVLHIVKADMQVDGSSWLMVEAKEGHLLAEDKLLFLEGDVRLFHDSGYEFNTDKVRVDTGKGDAFSESSVKGQGEAGYITAERFSAYNRGERMVFDGNVRMKILPNQLKN